MKKLFAIALCLLAAGALSAGGSKEAKASGAAPHIVVYNNNGGISAAGGETSSSAAVIAEMRAWLLKGSGVDVEIIAPVVGQEEQKLNLLLSSGAQVDAFWGKWTDFAPRNMILPLNDLVKKYGPSIVKAWPAESIKDMSDAKGTLWGLPRSTPVVGNPVFIRADWAKKYGMQVPATIDELEAYMAAVKKNEPGAIPLLAEMKGKHGSAGIFQTFLGAFTEYGSCNWLDSDGMIKPQELQPGFKDFIVRMNKWYKAGYIYPEFASLNRNVIRDLIKAGKVAMNATWYSNVTVPYSVTLANNPGIDFQIPKGGLVGPKGKAETIKTAGPEGMMISAKSKASEAVMQVMEFFYKDPGNHQIAYMGPEGGLWQWTDKTKLKFKILKDRTGYLGDYALAMGLPMERAVATDSPQMKKHFDFIGVGTLGTSAVPDLLDYSRGKWPTDTGVVYDPKTIEKEVPGYNDLERMREEEVIKFIMGARPIGEWDDFIKELYSVGLNDWIKCFTKMYKAQK